jgi:hypothetical protein
MGRCVKSQQQGTRRAWPSQKKNRLLLGNYRRPQPMQDLSCLLQSRQSLDKAGQLNGAVGERFGPIFSP